MNRLLNSISDIYKILGLFIVWKIVLIAVLFYAVRFIPLGSFDRYLGGGSIFYNSSPEFFSWANFDGEHYLSIAMYGYKSLEQAFFPLYPLLISFFAKPISGDFISLLVNSTLVGLLVSNITFCLSLLFIYKLLVLDFSKKIALLTIVIILVFPTSFYFGAFYNESLFLFLSVLCFYFARKRIWLFSAVFGVMASSTRVFGFLLLPALLFEVVIQREKLSKWFWIMLIPLGLISYMYYQYINFGDPFAFYNLQTVVGEQHQKGIVLLPQVYFRYMKMLLTVDINNPIYQTIILEFITGVSFFILPIIGFLKKIRSSYIFYALVGFILPTVQGSFSSLPRYVIVFFPSFLILALLISKLNAKIQMLVIVLLLIFLMIESGLFFRGYWIS